MALNCPDATGDIAEGCADYDWFETHVYTHLDEIVDKINVHLVAEGTSPISYISRPSVGDCAGLDEIERIETFLDSLFATGRLPKYAWDAGNPGFPFPDPVNANDVQDWIDCDAYWTDLQEVRDCLTVDAPGQIFSESNCLCYPPANVFHKILICLAEGSCYPACECPECQSGCWQLYECSPGVDAIVVSDNLQQAFNNDKIIKYNDKCYTIFGEADCDGTEIEMGAGNYEELGNCPYELQDCESPTNTITVFDNLAGKAVVKYQGVCYAVVGQTNCDINTITMGAGNYQVYNNCPTCLQPCYELTDCNSPDKIYVTNDLADEQANNKVVKYDGICYTVDNAYNCTGEEITMAAYDVFDDCPTCPPDNLKAVECDMVYRYDTPQNQQQLRHNYEYQTPVNNQAMRHSYEYQTPKNSQALRHSYEYLPAVNPVQLDIDYVNGTYSVRQSYRYEEVIAINDSPEYSYRYEEVVAINESPEYSYRYEEVTTTTLDVTVVQ